MSNASNQNRAAASAAVVPANLSDLTPDWLSATLRRAGFLPRGRVTSVRPNVIGADTGFSSLLARLIIEYDAPGRESGPPSLILKLPSLDRQMRAWVELYQGYEREIRFYKEFSDRSTLPTPRCFYADTSQVASGSAKSKNRRLLQRLPHWVRDILQPVALWVQSRSSRRYALLLEDMAEQRLGDQITGADLPDARTAMRGLGELHGGFWEDAAVVSSDWIPDRLGSAEWARSAYRRHSDRFYAELEPRAPDSFRHIMDWADENLAGIMERLRRAPRTLLHGDYRLDNLFFAESNLWAIDWGSVSVGPGVLDCAYFTTGNLREEITETDEQSLIHIYLEAVREHDTATYSSLDCDRDYRLAKIFVAHNQVSAPIWTGREGKAFDLLMQRWNQRLIERMPGQGWDELLDQR